MSQLIVEIMSRSTLAYHRKNDVIIGIDYLRANSMWFREFLRSQKTSKSIQNYHNSNVTIIVVVDYLDENKPESELPKWLIEVADKILCVRSDGTEIVVKDRDGY